MSHPDTDPPSDGEAGGIPLFSARDNVARPKGEFVTIPLHELRSWEQVFALYGGDCMYQVVAQSPNHKFSAFSEKAYFAGPPRKSPKKRRAR